MSLGTPLRSGDPVSVAGYRVIARLGSGGQGTVFLGQAVDGARVAVKLLHARLDDNPDARVRFAREIDAARRVAPFCTARVLDADVECETPYLVSEFIDGPALSQVVHERGPLSSDDLHRLAVGTATALVAIHAAGVVHRDFKPANILMGHQGPRVVDFGIARALDVTSTLTSQVVGTPAYMAPEQATNDPVSAATDIFAWGATMVFAASGRPPFGRGDIPTVLRRVRTQDPDLGGLGEALHAIVTSCLAKNPADRPTAETLLHRLLHGSTPSLAAPHKTTADTRFDNTATPALRQLPADTAFFTGRDDELDRLLALVEHAGSADSPGTVVITAIDGMGGIGKTALAIRAAHRLAGRFPDGQLFIDLYGFTQSTAPRDPGNALATLLSSLGVPPGQIPADLDARAAFYRDRLVGTRTLILLDNAADEAQVRPLLPATDTCLVLITSRRRLKALDDALPLSLDVLPLEEAVALLHRAARLDDHARHEVLLARAAELCGRLPLALLIAGALLRTGGKVWNLPLLIDRLAARQPGRELAGYTDETRSLEAVFDLSYRNLPEDQRLLLRRLGLLPGPEIDADAAAALLETNPDEAGRLLQRLADHSLLTGASPGRYRPHDLIRAHARSLAVTLDPEPERNAAQDRLLHYYAHTAQTASLPIARLPRPGPHGPAPAHAPDLTDPDAARAWLRAEYPNLEAGYTHVSANALEGHAIALAAGLAEILQTDGPFSRALEIHQAAAEAAERQRQPAAQATALNDLGRMRYHTADYRGAGDAHARALEISREAGNHLGEANALNDLGRMRYVTGDLPGAADAQAQALEIYRRIGNRLGEANALTNLGQMRYIAGDFPGAAEAIMRALEILRRIDNRLGEANALNDLGRVRYMTGDYPGAADALERALEISREIGNRLGEANALTNLGRVWDKIGDLPGAADAQARALEIHRQIGNRRGEANALTNLGRVRYMTGDLPGAADAQERALEIHHQIGDRIGLAGALSWLGQVRCSTGDLPGAADALARALEIYRQIGDRVDECWTLTHYAATIAATGDRPRALALYEQALTMSREINAPAGEAVSLEGIAEHHLATGNPTQGIEYLRQALHIYQRLGMRADIERVIADLAGPAPQ